MVADNGGGGRAGHWDHADAPASIAKGERGHRSHDRQRIGQESERDHQHTGAMFGGNHGYIEAA